MPEFSNPFSIKKSDRKLTNEEIIRGIRFNIAAEYEAIQLYEGLAESIDNEKAKNVLYEKADDQRVHAGCFIRLLEILAPDEKDFYKEGAEEIDNLLKT